jgi:tRNA-splicing ligase RtcB
VEHINNRLISYASILEEQTRRQAEQTSTMPFIHPHIALMADAHLGKGSTVGSVIPTLGAIMPAAVGVDIGCGMIAVRTQFTKHDFTQSKKSLTALRESIEAAIPTSAGKYNTELTNTAKIRVDILTKKALESAEFSPSDYSPNWALQLGTLGGGNHFIEITIDEEDRVWLFLHSGSRGVGNRIAQRHIKIAAQQCEKRWINLPNPDLAYLVEGDPEFWCYIREMRWAQEFAWMNREEMMDRLMLCVEEWSGEPIEQQETVNCHHNYTTSEKHFGKQVWLSRKGAIDASSGTMGLIPGSMGTASYVVEGKGNHVALNSSPHGAGRNFSRKKARETFTHDDLREAMKGIEYRDSAAFVDEIPGAYKDIDVVMADSTDLVTIKHTLHQILNVKGD